MKFQKKKFLFVYAVGAALLTFLCIARVSFASTTDGTIDATSKYAWGSNIGWVNFGTSGGNVHITDTVLTGYAWSENYGWINLSPSLGGVTNDGTGILSGYAWGEKLGWISFSGVSISSSGVFAGSAAVSSTPKGSISFDCTNCSVRTDWRPASVRNGGGGNNNGGGGTSNGGGGGGGTGYYTTSTYPAATSSAPGQPLMNPSGTGIAPPYQSPAGTRPGTGGGTASIVNQIPGQLLSILGRVQSFFGNLFFPKQKPLPQVDIAKLLTKKAPFALGGFFDLISAREMGAFVLAPLPKEFAALVKQFPKFGQTLSGVGIARMTDLPKLANATLVLPGLHEAAGIAPVALSGGTSTNSGIPSVGIAPGHFALPSGIPLASMGAKLKQQIPKEIVFARTGGEKIDFSIGLTLNNQGILQKTIRTVVGSSLNLAVKPGAPALSVRGYLVLRTRLPQEELGVAAPPNVLASSLVGKLFADAVSVFGPSAPVTPSVIREIPLQDSLPLQKLSASIFFAVPDFGVRATKTNYIVDPVRGREALQGDSVGISTHTGAGIKNSSSTRRASASSGIDPVRGAIPQASAGANKTLANVADALNPTQTISNGGGVVSGHNTLAGESVPAGEVEDRFALSEFEYTDPDGDGIYTATINAPRVDGEYDIITLISYKDPTVGTREIRLTTIVDPEGYVFEKQGDKEVRIPGAVVSLYTLNPANNKYELWPAHDYHQENPQITDVRGTYAFLVPQGYYYIGVIAPGYGEYQGKPFEVSENNEVHFNIELSSKYGWLWIVDWKTLLLIIVTLLLLYNFYQDRKRRRN